MWTVDDQTAVKNAVMELATGRRVVKLTIAGKVHEFGQADLPQLRSLLSEITAEVGVLDGSASASFAYTRTSKGL